MFFLSLCCRAGPEPVCHFLPVCLIYHNRINMCRFLRRSKFHTCITQCSKIKRLSDSVFFQKSGGQKLIRVKICQNFSIAHKNNTVHISPQNILQTVLNDHHRSICFFLNLVDQLNSLLTCSRIQIGQWLVEQQNFHLIHHYPRQADALLLPSGKLVGRVIQMILNSDQLCRVTGDLMHFILRHAAVFQCKGNILANRQPDKLTIRILQHCAHMCRELKNAALRRIHTIHNKFPAAFSWIGKRIQAIDAACQSTFSTAGRTCDQHPLARINIQINFLQRRLFLCPVLERKVFERNNRRFFLCHIVPQNQIS